MQIFKRKKNRSRIIIVFFAVILLVFSSIDITLADTGEDDSDKKEIVLEVVEDIPAQDLGESEVPLADGPNGSPFDLKTVILWAAAVIILATVLGLVNKRRLKKRQDKTVKLMEKAFREGDKS